MKSSNIFLIQASIYTIKMHRIEMLHYALNLSKKVARNRGFPRFLRKIKSKIDFRLANVQLLDSIFSNYVKLTSRQ